MFREGRPFFVGAPDQTENEPKITPKSPQNGRQSHLRDAKERQKRPEDPPKADRRRAEIWPGIFGVPGAVLGAVEGFTSARRPEAPGRIFV